MNEEEIRFDEREKLRKLAIRYLLEDGYSGAPRNNRTANALMQRMFGEKWREI